MYQNLKDILKAEGISREDYSIVLGISKESVKNKLNGKTEFTYSEFKKTVLLLRKYNADYLFEETVEKAS